MSNDPYNPWKTVSASLPLPSGDNSRKKSAKPELTVADLSPFSPAWWDERNAIMAAIGKQQRARGIVYTEDQRKDSDAAVNMALTNPGDEGYAEILKQFQSRGDLKIARWHAKRAAQAQA